MPKNLSPSKKEEKTKGKKIKKFSSVSFEEKFYSDLELKDMIHAKLIRCMDTGRIVRISYPDLPEGYFWFTARDIPGQHFIGNYLGRVPIFCEGEILYPGEPVGILAGPDENLLEELSQDIKIICTEETLAASLNLENAEKENEGESQEDPLSIIQEIELKKENSQTKNQSEENEDSGEQDEGLLEIFSEVLAERKVQSGPCFEKEGGGLEKVFESCAHVIEHEWSYEMSPPEYGEPNGALCSWDGKNISVYAPTQWISNLRQTLSASLAIDAENIIIKKTKSFNRGSNSVWYNSIIVCQVAVAAYKIGKPVKLVLSRQEQELYMDKMRSVKIRHKTGCAKDGKIAAMKIDIDFDAGAHNPFAQEIMDRLVIASCGCYNPLNVSITAHANSSSYTPSSMDLRLVDSASFFAVENQMNLLCEECGISPLEIRMINFLDKDIKSKSLPFSFKLKNYFSENETFIKGKDIDFQKEQDNFVLAKPKDISYTIPSYGLKFSNSNESLQEFMRKYESYRQEVFHRRNKNDISLLHSKNSLIRGIGFACAFEGSCYFGSQIYGGNDQSLEVTYTEDKIITIHCPPVSASIQDIWKKNVNEILHSDVSAVKINSVFRTTEEPLLPESVYSNISVMTQLLKKCCEALKVKIVKEGKKIKFPVTVKKSVTNAQKKLWNKNLFSGQPFHNTSFAAAILELELDPCTFREKIKWIEVFIDGGKILNPVAAQSAVRLGIQKTLSSLVEKEQLECRLQDIKISFMESNEPPSQIGEEVYHIIPAAYTQALSQALDYSIDFLPLTTESIYRTTMGKYAEELRKALVMEIKAVSQTETEISNAQLEAEQ